MLLFFYVTNSQFNTPGYYRYILKFFLKKLTCYMRSTSILLHLPSFNFGRKSLFQEILPFSSFSIKFAKNWLKETQKWRHFGRISQNLSRRILQLASIR